MTSPARLLLCAGSLLVAGSGAFAQVGPGRNLVNFETPHIHPIDITPDGSKLVAVNTPDNRLEVFDLVAGLPVYRGSIPVGLDPVSVRARSDGEVWVVNHISDSVSIVNLTTMNVSRTLTTSDEPWDVAFASPVNGAPSKAFVSTGTFRIIHTFDLANLTNPPTNITVDGEQPRALGVSPDGSTVYCAVFESGNKTTLLGGGSSGSNRLAFPPNVVSDPTGPYAGQNPPPNTGTTFTPPLSSDASPTIGVGLIVRQNAQGQWMDDNSHDWTSFVSGSQAARSGRPVGWTLTDHDCAVIDSNTLSVTYADSLMTICMAVGINPATGAVHVVGTDAHNELRFEPNVNGRFVRVRDAFFSPGAPNTSTIVDLNPHLDYSVPNVSTALREQSIGDPRAIAFHPSGTFGFVAGMGSGNVVRIDSSGARQNTDVAVGAGPTGLVFSPAGDRLYVMSKFDATISVVDPSSVTELTRVPLFDPTPVAIKAGRPHFYGTHLTSGLGQVACASCHVDGKTDRLSWDLGDPSGARGALTSRNLGFGIPFLEPNTTSPAFQSFHPMKGPMLTQTFQDIIGHEPFHWRGDRLGLEQFNGAFMSLQGADQTLSTQEMQEFESFVATIAFPPNPNRNFDNTLPTNLPLPGHFKTGRFGPAGQPLPNGNAVAGLSIYRSSSRRLDSGAFACVTCHTLPTGMGPDMVRSPGLNGTFQSIPVGPNGEHHLGLVSVDGSTNVSMKVPQLRNLYKRTGFNATQTTNRVGYGLLHDGSVDSIERFVGEPVFNVNSDAEIANLVAFMLSFSGSDLPQGSSTNVFEPPGTQSKDVPASVGAQVTIAGTPDQATLTRLNAMVNLANLNKVGLVAKGFVNGLPRGFAFTGSGVFQSDRQSQTFTQAQLINLAGVGTEMTFTVVPKGSEIRIGIDRDSDGWLDRDELDVCADPANPLSFPGSIGNADFNGDLVINADDLADFITAYFNAPPDPNADFNGDGLVNADDLADFITRYFDPCAGG